jgi:D-sedoheptulose 7-phosphate isomerase
VSDSALDEHLALVATIRDLLPEVGAVARAVIGGYERGGCVYAFGNGGSAADAQHLVGELIGRFARDRRPLAAVTLSVDPSAVTCIANDYSFEDVFARQVEALAGPDDIVVGYTTSGASENVVRGLAAAKRAGATTVLFTGGTGGAALEHADHSFSVPSGSTARVQEMHLLLMHLVVEEVDAWANGARA